MLPLILSLGCGPELAPTVETIELADGTYQAVIPAEGSVPMPVTVFFHGWKGSASQYTRNEDIIAGWTSGGMLWLLPEASGESWNMSVDFGGSRDDVAFTAAILDDADARWGIDRERVYAAGFSAGGAMATFLGCHHGAAYAAITTISGGFWHPAPASCSSEPLSVNHLHGIHDGVWPIDGRCFIAGEDGACILGQAPLEDDLAVWRDHLGCSGTPASSVQGTSTCQIWLDCDRHHQLQVCLHPGRHEKPLGWPAAMAQWMVQFSD